MVMTSDQIAQQNGMYQGMAYQQAMMSRASYQMHSPYGAMGAEGASERYAGRGINTLTAMAPLASVGMGMMGVDPISMGLSAGMSAGAKAGIGVGLGVGAATAGVVALPLMAAQYAGSEMLHGMQQQQQLNNAMRGSFTFQNQHGGRGFTRQQIGQIGSSLRTEAGAVGQMGEMHSFEEMSRLAANMGRMGMAQNVRSAKEFSEKFKGMVASLKEIAHEFGTTLEESQKMMAGMRNVGVFKPGDASQMAKRISSAALAGNLATSEFTSMQSIGAQISRSVGGLGRSGQAAGVQAMSHVGAALSTGVLSESQIYETTGLSGAEGRRAFATGMLQRESQFMSSRLGRRALAAMAGKDGKLDRSSVERFMSGEVGTDDTMNMAHQNLAKVGRANFIRNEGRLRGEVMAQFGGMAPAMIMKGWLNKRGIDVGTGGNEEQDKALIFMQRRMGMGTEESENMIRMVKGLPEMMEKRKDSAELEQYARHERERLSKQGLEGVKKKVEKFRSDVNNALRQAGADIYKGVADKIEGFINGIVGSNVSIASDGMLEFSRSTEKAGRAGSADRRGLMGSGASILGGRASATSFSEGGKHGVISHSEVTGRGVGLGLSRDATALEKKLAASIKGNIQESLATKSTAGMTQDMRVDQIMKLAKASDDPEVKKMIADIEGPKKKKPGEHMDRTATAEKRAALAAILEREAMGSDFSSGAAGIGGLQQAKHELAARSGVTSLAEYEKNLGERLSGRQQSMGQWLTGTKRSGKSGWDDAASTLVNGGLAAMTLGAIGGLGDKGRGWLEPALGAAHSTLLGKAGAEYYGSALGNKETLANASAALRGEDTANLDKRLATLGTQERLSQSEMAEKDVLNISKIGGQYMAEMADARDSNAKYKIRKRYAKKLGGALGKEGFGVEDLDDAVQGAIMGVTERQEANAAEIIGATAKSSRDILEKGRVSGQITVGEDGTTKLTAAGSKGMSSTVQALTEEILQKRQKLAGLSGGSGSTAREYDSLLNEMGDDNIMLAGQSADALAAAAAGGGHDSSKLSYLAHRRKLVDKAAGRASNYGESGKAANALAAAAGLDLSSDELKGLKGASSEKIAETVLARGGVTSDSARKAMTGIAERMKNNRGEGDAMLRQFLETEEGQGVKKSFEREGIRGNQSKSLDAVVDSLSEIQSTLAGTLQVNVTNASAIGAGRDSPTTPPSGVPQDTMVNR